jgi:hypothetical protein
VRTRALACLPVVSHGDGVRLGTVVAPGLSGTEPAVLPDRVRAIGPGVVTVDTAPDAGSRVGPNHGG